MITMYELYAWYAWGFGNHWVYQGKFETKQAAYCHMKNKNEATYKIIKDNKVVEYHEAPHYCWRYGMSIPIKTEAT